MQEDTTFVCICVGCVGRVKGSALDCVMEEGANMGSSSLKQQGGKKKVWIAVCLSSKKDIRWYIIFTISTISPWRTPGVG
jgi:hypothetical protein